MFPPSGADGGGGGSGDASAPAPDVSLPSDAAPTVPNPAAVKILPGQTDLLGSFQNGCTSGPGSDRWCAVSRLASALRRELWLVNVSQAAASTPSALVSACDVPGLCVKATDNLYTAQPQVGPAYPFDVARASGNTFVYLTDPRSAPTEPFVGDVWAHTIGSPNTTRIGSGVSECTVAGQRLIASGTRQIDKVVALCVGDPSSAPGDPVPFFTLMGGVVPGQTVGPQSAPLPLMKMMTTPLGEVQRVYPVHPTTMVPRYRLGFTADNEVLALSTGGALESEAETLVTYKTDDLGKGVPPTPFPGGDNITRWTLTPDGTKIFYLKDYNYSAVGNQSGTLTTADFPAGTNLRELRGMLVPGGSSNGVSAYQVLVDNQGALQGVGILTNLTMGRGGNYSIIKDTAGSTDDPSNVVSIIEGTSLPTLSPDLRFSLFGRQSSSDPPSSGTWLIKNDGSNAPCFLTSGQLGGVFGPAFTRSSGLVLWAENYQASTFSADSFYSDPAGCTDVAKQTLFARNLDFWFVDGDRLLLYSDDSDGARVSLKYAWINGNTLSAPVTIQNRADRKFDIVVGAQPPDGSPPRFKGILYTLSGASDPVNGVYYYEIPASTAP